VCAFVGLHCNKVNMSINSSYKFRYGVAAADWQ